MHGSAASKIETEREIQLERERERGAPSLVSGESNLACQALSFAVSEGGLIPHLDETLDGFPIPENEEDDSHWVDVEPPAEQITAGDSTRPKGGDSLTLTRTNATFGANQNG